MPIMIQKTVIKNDSITPPYGLISLKDSVYKNKILDYNLDTLEMKPDLHFSLTVPKQDVMLYFIQWQRYRKYWWSSITTTPSLFSIGDVNQDEYGANVGIVANLPYGEIAVENINIKNQDNLYQQCSSLTCTMALEKNLLVLLLDAANNCTKEGYLRLHRKIAPYKMSFALNCEEPKNRQTLEELATLLYHRLKLERISALLPDFSKSLEDQTKESLAMGVPYTAIISETTLENGIFHLMNSSTMLKEQIHVADFHNYAAFVCTDK